MAVRTSEAMPHDSQLLWSSAIYCYLLKRCRGVDDMDVPFAHIRRDGTVNLAPGLLKLSGVQGRRLQAIASKRRK